MQRNNKDSEKMRFRIHWKSLTSIGSASCAAATSSFVGLQGSNLPVSCDSFRLSEVEGNQPNTKSSHTKAPEQYDTLTPWCDRMGIKLDPHVFIRDARDCGRGVFVSGKGISAGSVIMTIPLSMVITADNTENDPGLGHIMGPLRSAGLDDRGAVALWLLFQSLSKDSEWSDYISHLPGAYELSRSHLLLNSDALDGTPLGVSVKKIKSNISRQIRTVMRAIRKLDPPGCLLSLSPSDLEQAWTWAHAIVLTRSGIIRDECTVSDWTRIPVSIIPMIDFCNHSDDSVAEIRINKNSVELIALRDLKPGDEVTISYWPECDPLNSEQSLFSFGFLSSVDRFILPGVHFENADENPRRAIQRLLLLDQKPSSESIHLEDMDMAIDYFSVEAMSEREVVEIAKSLTKEAGIGTETRKLLASRAESGKLRLLHCITQWEREIIKCKSDSPVVQEYIKRLITAIKKSKSILDS
jgi:hypothetical protein